MSTQTPFDLYEYYQITPNPDGTLTPNPDRYTKTQPSSDPTDPDPVLSEDIIFNPTTKTWARVYLPKRPTTEKLPLIVYYHGGGFFLLSADSSVIHAFCSALALELPAAVVSVNYRLAPEHRLSAAYDDAVDAIRWLRDDEGVADWFKDRVDFGRFFIMGSSTGGNMAYLAAQRVAGSAKDLLPLKVNGLILSQPFFGGTQGTESESRNTGDPVIPPGSCELVWELALPVGVDREHEYSNPTAGDGEPLEVMGKLGWRVFVSGCEGDPLVDRQIAVAKLMEEKGIGVVTWFVEGGYHGNEIRDPSEAHFSALKEFIASVSLV